MMDNIIETHLNKEKNTRIDLFKYDGFFFVQVSKEGETVHINRHLRIEHAKKEMKPFLERTV